MTYVLVVISWLGVANGAVISTQEFSSAERCEAARTAPRYRRGVTAKWSRMAQKQLRKL